MPACTSGLSIDAGMLNVHHIDAGMLNVHHIDAGMHV